MMNMNLHNIFFFPSMIHLDVVYDYQQLHVNKR